MLVLYCIMLDEVIKMSDTEQKQLQETLLQSLYDYHFANDGAAYTLPKAMVNTDPNSKLAIEELVDNGYATDSGQGTDNLVLAITAKGIEYVKNK